MTEHYTRITGETMLGVQQQDKFLFVANASTAIPLDTRAVEAVVSSANVTLTLPSVAEAAGMFVHIYAITSNGFDLTVQDLANDAGLTSIVSADDGINEVFLYSTGRQWINIGCNCGVMPEPEGPP